MKSHVLGVKRRGNVRFAIIAQTHFEIISSNTNYDN